MGRADLEKGRLTVEGWYDFHIWGARNQCIAVKKVMSRPPLFARCTKKLKVKGVD
ncbi:hypothetical protein GGTG_09588 [Gaeumannomyces tritici R3-111a-1]|uniref:Uncharacterized protein n=1 Tax=Gaeumannomyces tritici (strain R3-111a-1) TaxID=644352 RepID=J3P7U7_GAET3|nr:hypothetical protein GGTG_09588 [Gaeumannomyces tritici R3-111a-1]EJT72730.1 hypothetical protein GGTG_09588 [Gaeumannomyces tritici R3-111a-1]